MTPCCRLQVQNPTQALMSVKGPGNTFDLSPKLTITLPSLIYFSWDINREPTSTKNKFQYQSWYLTPCCWLEVQKPTQALQSIKCPDNTVDVSPKWTRTLPFLIYFFMGYLWRPLLKDDIWHRAVGSMHIP